MAEPLAVVTVGKSEWLFLKSTPSDRRAASAGALCGVTLCDRRPSATKMITLRAAAPVGARNSSKTVAPNAARGIDSLMPGWTSSWGRRYQTRLMAGLRDSSSAPPPPSNPSFAVNP